MSGCRPIAPRDLARVIEAMRGRFVLRNRALVVVGVRTGFRIAELLSLTLGDVVADGSREAGWTWRERISVPPRRLKGGAVSTGSRPSLPVPKRVRASVLPWLRRLMAEGRLTRRQGAWVGIDWEALIAEPRLPGRKGRRRVEGRSVPMHVDVPRALAPWLEQLRQLGFMRREDFLFQSHARGNRAITTSQAWRVFKTALGRVGILDATGTHMLRKSFAQMVMEAFSGDIFKTAQALGHADVKSTQAYMGTIKHEVDEAIRHAPGRLA